MSYDRMFMALLFVISTIALILGAVAVGRENSSANVIHYEETENGLSAVDGGMNATEKGFNNPSRNHHHGFPNSIHYHLHTKKDPTQEMQNMTKIHCRGGNKKITHRLTKFDGKTHKVAYAECTGISTSKITSSNMEDLPEGTNVVS